jgi:hypothetical protein
MTAGLHLHIDLLAALQARSQIQEDDLLFELCRFRPWRQHFDLDDGARRSEHVVQQRDEQASILLGSERQQEDEGRP